jgi:HK97 family phage portal protein
MKDAVRSLTLSGLSLKDHNLNRYFDIGARTDAGVSVTEANVLGYAAVWQAVTLIAGDVGSLPLIFYKKLPSGGKERYTSHPLYYMLHDSPNPEMSSMVFRETLQAHLLIWGNAYAEIERDRVGRPVALWPLLPTQVRPFRDGQVLRYRVSSHSGAPDVILEQRDMLHVPGLGFDGMVGYSVVHMGRQSFGLSGAAEKFGATFFGNGTTFGGALKHPKVLGDKAQKSLRESITAYHAGPDKAHRFLILEEGMDYVRFGIPPNEAQFLETRKFQIAEVARWFNLPVSKLREMDNSSVRANIEQEALDYVISTLRPWLVRWEQELKRKLISSLERNTQDIEFNIAGLLRGDLPSRYSAYAVGRQWGWLSANEIRELENLNPIPDGDKYLSPVNMVPADRVDEVIDKQVEPTPAPQPAPVASGEGDERAVTELLARLEAQAASIGELQVRCETVQLALTTAEADKATLTAAVAASEADLRAAEQSRNEWRSELAKFSETAEGIRAALTTQRDEADAKAAAAEAKATVAESRAEAAEAKVADLATQVAYRDASIDALRTEIEEVQQLKAAAEADAKEARAETAGAIVRAEDAEAVKERAEADAVAAMQLAAKAVQRADEAVAQQQVAEQARDEAVRTLADRLSAVLTAQRALAVDTMTRLVNYETEKARRAQQSPAKLRAWITTFYPDHERAMTDRLTPVMAAHLALLGKDDDPVEAARQLAQAHIAESRGQLEAVAELATPEELSGTLAQLTDRWERQRAEATADRLMRAEIAHVRELR